MSGLFLKDEDNIGKMDPFCEISYNRFKQKTKTHHGAGKSPVWNQ